jgi:hypothetical protein
MLSPAANLRMIIYVSTFDGLRVWDVAHRFKAESCAPAVLRYIYQDGHEGGFSDEPTVVGKKLLKARGFLRKVDCQSAVIRASRRELGVSHSL